MSVIFETIKLMTVKESHVLVVFAQLKHHFTVLWILKLLGILALRIYFDLDLERKYFSCESM